MNKVTTNGCPSHPHTNAVGNNPNSAYTRTYIRYFPLLPVRSALVRVVSGLYTPSRLTLSPALGNPLWSELCLVCILPVG